MISPQVPTGRAVRQAVLSDEANGQLLDATGVEALGQCEVGQVGGEVTATGSASMSGEGDDQIDGAADAGIAEVVECACADPVSSGVPAAPGTGTCSGIA